LDELSAVPFWELVHPDDQQWLMEDRERLVLRSQKRCGRSTPRPTEAAAL
jgi:hypothetical protein